MINIEIDRESIIQRVADTNQNSLIQYNKLTIVTPVLTYIMEKMIVDPIFEHVLSKLLIGAYQYGLFETNGMMHV